jgi:hypothetical protein
MPFDLVVLKAEGGFALSLSSRKALSPHHFEKPSYPVIPRSAATRDLFKFATDSRHIPKYRSLASLGMTREEGN